MSIHSFTLTSYSACSLVGCVLVKIATGAADNTICYSRSFVEVGNRRLPDLAIVRLSQYSLSGHGSLFDERYVEYGHTPLLFSVRMSTRWSLAQARAAELCLRGHSKPCNDRCVRNHYIPLYQYRKSDRVPLDQHTFFRPLAAFTAFQQSA